MHKKLPRLPEGSASELVPGKDGAQPPVSEESGGCGS